MRSRLRSICGPVIPVQLTALETFDRLRTYIRSVPSQEGLGSKKNTLASTSVSTQNPLYGGYRWDQRRIAPEPAGQEPAGGNQLFISQYPGSTNSPRETFDCLGNRCRVVGNYRKSISRIESGK